MEEYIFSRYVLDTLMNHYVSLKSYIKNLKKKIF